MSDSAYLAGGVGFAQIWIPSAAAVMHIAFQWVDALNYNYVTIATGSHIYDWTLRVLQVRAGVETLVVTENFSTARPFPITTSSAYFCLQWESGTLRVQLEQTLPASSPPASGARGHVIRTYAIPWLPATLTAVKGTNGAHLGGIADPPDTGMNVERPPSDMGGCVVCNHIVNTPFDGCCRQNLIDDWQVDLSAWSTAANGRFTGCQAVANVYILEAGRTGTEWTPTFSQDGWVYAQRGPTACNPITNIAGVTNNRLYLQIRLSFGRNMGAFALSQGCGWLLTIAMVIVSTEEACEPEEIIAAYWKAVNDPASCSGSHTLALSYQNNDILCSFLPNNVTIQSVSLV